MVDASKSEEQKRLLSEVESLRAKVELTRNARTRDGAELERLERTTALVERQIDDLA
jgi:predicted ATP-dependent serine protease